MMADANAPTSRAFWRILGLLDGAKRVGKEWQARCPAHEDNDPSLNIREGLDGRVLLICRSNGCSFESITKALGIEPRECFDRTDDDRVIRRHKIINGRGELLAIHYREGDGPNKKIEWHRDGKKGLGGQKPSELPLYGLPDVQAAPDGSTVYLTEGEKAADALTSHGLLAASLVGGKNNPPSTAVLKFLTRHQVILWPDNDADGGGVQVMQTVAHRIGQPVRWVNWPNAPDKGDAYDYFDSGGTVKGLDGLISNEPPRAEEAPARMSRVEILNAVELLAREFQPPRWAVPGVMCEGLIILSGRPKMGKSWLGLGLAIDVALGGLALDKIRVEQGESLYLALEDGPRRVQERVMLMLGDRPMPAALHIATEWPKLDEGGLDELCQWLDTHPRARMVTIDTFKRIRGHEDSRQRLYDLDYDSLEPLAALARQYGIAIVVVFHNRKGDSEDPTELISGTTGLSGIADAVLVLRRERGQADASLFVTGRDIEERDMALRWHGEDSERFHWEWIGEAKDYRRSRQRNEILDVIQTTPGAKPIEIAGAMGERDAGRIRYLLFCMVRDQEVRVRDGKYYPVALPANGANAPTSPKSVDGAPPPKETTNAVQGAESGQSGVFVAESPIFGDPETPKRSPGDPSPSLSSVCSSSGEVSSVRANRGRYMGESAKSAQNGQIDECFDPENGVGTAEVESNRSVRADSTDSTVRNDWIDHPKSAILTQNGSIGTGPVSRSVLRSCTRCKRELLPGLTDLCLDCLDKTMPL